jgi:hypothetical protein
VLDCILLEKAGIPSVAVVTDAFVVTGRAMAASWGIPDFPFISVPHPVANLNSEELMEYAFRASREAVDLLSAVKGV